MAVRYVLITAAHNEDVLIGRTIESVVAQSCLPIKWLIASDNSTDRTDSIVTAYARKYPFIELLRITKPHERNFGAQVDAINAGYRRVRDLRFEFVSNLDADITLPTGYYDKLARKFENNPALGLAGGFIYEDSGRGFRNRRTNNSRSVAHAVQFFRRECFDQIGGYIPLKYGGPDWVAEVMARQRGWRVESFPELHAFHHRNTGTAGSLLGYWFQQGRMDYSIGVLPSFEVVKCARRLGAKPFVVGAIARLAAFATSSCMSAPRLVSQDFVRYLRSEQKARMRAMIRTKAPQLFPTH